MNKCLICESTDLKEILDLGIHPNSDTFITKNFLPSENTNTKKYMNEKSAPWGLLLLILIVMMIIMWK